MKNYIARNWLNWMRRWRIVLEENPEQVILRDGYLEELDELCMGDEYYLDRIPLGESLYMWTHNIPKIAYTIFIIGLRRLYSSWVE